MEQLSGQKRKFNQSYSSYSLEAKKGDWAALQQIDGVMKIIFQDMLGIFHERTQSQSPSDEIFVKESIPFLISSIHHLSCLKRNLCPIFSFNKYYSFKYFYNSAFHTKFRARQAEIQKICTAVVPIANCISAFEPKVKARQEERYTNSSVAITDSSIFETRVIAIRAKIQRDNPDSSDIDKEFVLVKELFLDLLGNINYKYNINVIHKTNLAKASEVYSILDTKDKSYHIPINDKLIMKVFVKIRESSTNEDLFMYIMIGEIKAEAFETFLYSNGIFWTKMVKELQAVTKCSCTNKKLTDAFNNKSSERVK